MQDWAIIRASRGRTGLDAELGTDTISYAQRFQPLRDRLRPPATTRLDQRRWATSTTTPLQPVDAADVTILVDNAIDILVPDSEIAKRPPLVWEWSSQEQLRAEHGYSLLLTVQTA